VENSRSFRNLEQLLDDFRAGRCTAFFFFAAYPAGVQANCLCPQDWTEFRDVFVAAQAIAAATLETAGETDTQECADFDRYLTAGGTA
jgi:hypothetical protein